MLEINGHKYSKEKFDGYKMRYVVEFCIMDENNKPDKITSPIYSTDEDMERVDNLLLDRRKPNVCSITIVHRASKEQDELSAKFIEETLKDW